MDTLLQIGRRLVRGTKFLLGTSYPVDLGLICAAEHTGCMGLPQELIDCIIDLVRNDCQTLKACSLTCKSMFASARHLIHGTFRLTQRNNRSILTREEKKLLPQMSTDRELRFLTCAAERGLLQYAQQVFIRNNLQLDNHHSTFSPAALSPHLHHFRSLDRIHTLTIEHLDAALWLNQSKDYFSHFYPTLTSLKLHHPCGSYRAILQFALQFPNLDNLSFQMFPSQEGEGEDQTDVVIDQSPPLRGNLSLIGYNTTGEWPVDAIHELRNGMNFRSVELEAFSSDRVQHILNACGNTLEDLAIVPQGCGATQLEGLRLMELKVLRRLTLRMPFYRAYLLEQGALLRALWTITSPDFRELVLEVDKVPARLKEKPSEHWGCWTYVDKYLGTCLSDGLADNGGFKLIIRTGEVCDWELFQKHAKETFPLLAGKGCVHFETTDKIENYRS